jgi:hypothetical protein
LDVLNRFYVSYTGSPPTPAQMVTFAGSIGAAWEAHLAPMASEDVVLAECIAVDLSSPTAAVGEAPFDSAGGRSGGQLPAGVAALLNFHVARRYRGGKPRMYTVFGTESDLLTPQSWTGGFLTALLAAWESFISAVMLAPWSSGVITNQVNVSYYEGFTIEMHGTPPRARNVPTLRTGPLSLGDGVDVITSTSANGAFSSQRRRNRPK